MFPQIQFALKAIKIRGSTSKIKLKDEGKLPALAIGINDIAELACMDQNILLQVME